MDLAHLENSLCALQVNGRSGSPNEDILDSCVHGANGATQCLLPAIADPHGLPLDFTGLSDDDILEALTALSAVEQGAILGSWMHRLERTQTNPGLQHLMSRRLESAATVSIEANTQTDIEGARHLGEMTNEDLTNSIGHLNSLISASHGSISRSTELSNDLRKYSQEVNGAQFSAKGQADMCLSVCKIVVGHAARIESKMAATSAPPVGRKSRVSLLEKRMTQEGLLQTAIELAECAKEVQSSSESEEEAQVFGGFGDDEDADREGDDDDV